MSTRKILPHLSDRAQRLQPQSVPNPDLMVRDGAGSDLPKCLNLFRKNLILCTDSGLKPPISAIKLDG